MAGPYKRSFKITKSRQLVRKASQLLARRMGGTASAPLASRGFRPFTYGGRGVNAPELKYIDTAAVDQGIAAAGALVLVNGCATGTTVITRVGRKIVMKSITVSVNMFNAGAAAQTYPIGVSGKISLIYDSQPNGATAPGYTSIYQIAHPTSPLNLSNRDRYKVLWTKNFVIPSYEIAGGKIVGGSPTNVTRKGYKKCNLPVIFGGDGSTQADIQTGALYLTAIVDANLGAAFDYYIRVRYNDN